MDGKVYEYQKFNYIKTIIHLDLFGSSYNLLKILTLLTIYLKIKIIKFLMFKTFFDLLKSNFYAFNISIINFYNFKNFIIFKILFLELNIL